MKARNRIGAAVHNVRVTVAAIAVAAGLIACGQHSPTGSGDFTPSGTTGVGAGSDAYCHPQCTDFAACGQTSHTGTTQCSATNPSERLNFARCWGGKLFGDAGQWVSHAGSCVAAVSYPSDGSIVELQFAGGGHVANVDAASYDAGSGFYNLVISDYNWNLRCDPGHAAAVFDPTRSALQFVGGSGRGTRWYAVTGFMLGSGVDPRGQMPTTPSPVPPQPPVTPAPAVPHISALSPSSIVGSNFILTVDGSGFDGGAHDYVYKPDGSYLGSGQVQGTQTSRVVTYEQMAGAAPGTYGVEIHNGNGTVSNRVSLRLLDTVSVSPASATAGTQFTYAGKGFTGNFGVTSHLTNHGDLQIPTAADGTFSHPINSSGFPVGTYTVWATDNATGIDSQHVSFVVQ